MSSSRIFVSYACMGDEAGARIAKQLVNDIRATQTEAITDHETIPNERFIEFLNRELPQCGYLIVIQTPVALQSLRVQTTVNMALTLVTQQRIRGVLRLIAFPSQNTNNQSLWDTLYTFDASLDYPRARDKVFIELGLIHLDANDSFFMPFPTPAPSGPMSRPVGSNWPPQPSGPMSRPVGSNWPPQPSGPMSRPVGSNWPPQPSGPMSRPVGSNWPPQPSGPMSKPVGSNWPPQPSGPMSRPSAPANFSGTPASQKRSQLVSALKNVWRNISARFVRAWKTSQTSIAAQSPDKLLTLREDRPLPLHTLRRTMIRWAIVIGIILILALTIVLVKNHMNSQQPPIHHAKSGSISVPLPSSSLPYPR